MWDWRAQLAILLLHSLFPPSGVMYPDESRGGPL